MNIKEVIKLLELIGLDYTWEISGCSAYGTLKINTSKTYPINTREE